MKKTNAVIFCGAGASFAVSRAKYPTTVQFFRDHLPDSVKDNAFFRILTDYVREQKQRRRAEAAAESTENQIDIEEILFAATDLDDTFKRFDSDHVARFATHHSMFQQFGSYAHNVTNPLSNGRSQLRVFIDQVNAHIHNVYSTLPTQKELASTWTPLLSNFEAKFGRVDVFTTNYDLVIETALQLSPSKIGLGHSTLGYTTLDLPQWTQPEDVAGRLTKLHGSLNWTWGDAESSRIDIGSPRHVTPDRQVAIYPGYKGEPTREPFRAFHSYLERRLFAADTVLFVGFAFRDQFLNTLFGRALRPAQQKIWVIDPALIEEQLPFNFEQGVLLKKGFAEAVDDVISLCA